NGKKQGLVSIKPVFDKSNDVNEITVCIKDVTRLNEIIEKQSMLTNTVNRLNSEHIWIYRKNPDKFEFISKNAVNLYGIDVNELYKEPSLWKEFLHPDDKEKMEKTYNADKYPLTIKYRVINSEGNIHWVISRRFRGIDKQNKPYYYGINIDVTDSVMQNKKFHELDSAICHSNELIWLGKKTNQNNFKFEYISNNCKKIFGITLPKNKNFIIQKWIHYIYHDDRSKFIDFIKKTNFPKKMTFRIQLINKKLIYVSIKVFKYENTYCGILTDGTN
ncbi:MAG TPA: PAS domain-containing protein, partial [Victivallales bacterium]|nr:PAS domain-containing protein [Victivallales bacterium]